MRLQVSASALPRLFKCLASGLLAHEEYRTLDAELGVLRHKAMEDAVEAGDLDKLPPAVRGLVDGMAVGAEVALVYDAATGKARELGRQLGRSYGTLAPFEVPGTADLVAVGSGRVVVCDWKGWKAVDSPDSNRQTLLYALAASRVYSAREVTVAVAHIVDGCREVEIATLDAVDLDAYAAELLELFQRAAAAAADPHAHEVVGPHCEYCPAFNACDKQRTLALALKSDEVSPRIEAMIPLDRDEDAASAYELADRIRLLLKRLDAALYARAKERPIPLGGGRMFGEIEKLGNEKLDGDIVYEVVKAKHGQGIADAAVERTATKKRLREALGFVGAASVAADERAILDEVRKRGGSRRDRKVAIDEYEEQPALAAASAAE